MVDRFRRALAWLDDSWVGDLIGVAGLFTLLFMGLFFLAAGCGQ